MKYVIDITNDKITQNSTLRVLVTNESQKSTWLDTGIEVSPYDAEHEHKQVWDFLREISRMDDDEIEHIFNVVGWTRPIDGVLAELNYEDACKEYESWNRLKIGDVVEHRNYGKCILLEKEKSGSEELWNVLDEKGMVYQIHRKNITKKTDKHFQEVEILIKKLKEIEI